jgi:hypothetical protein
VGEGSDHVGEAETLSYSRRLRYHIFDAANAVVAHIHPDSQNRHLPVLQCAIIHKVDTCPLLMLVYNLVIRLFSERGNIYLPINLNL